MEVRINHDNSSFSHYSVEQNRADRSSAEKVDADTSLPRIDWPPETLPPTADIVKLATSNDMVACFLGHTNALSKLEKFISQ